MSAYAIITLCTLVLIVGIVIGMVWGTWEARQDAPRTHDQAELERRLRQWPGDGGNAFHDHPAVATKALPYDRRREDQPI